MQLQRSILTMKVHGPFPSLWNALALVGALLQLGCGARPETAQEALHQGLRSQTPVSPDSLLAHALEIIDAKGMEAIRMETNLTTQSHELALIVRVLSLAGEVSKAEALIRATETPERVKTEAYGALSEGYLRLDQNPDAARIIDHILEADTWVTSTTLPALVEIYRELGEEEEARRLLRRIPDLAVQAQTSMDWVLYAETRGHTEAAKEWAVATLGRACQVPPAEYPGPHVPTYGRPGQFRRELIIDHSARQALLLALVRFFREHEEPARVAETLQAIDEIDHQDKHLWMSHALVILATHARQDENVEGATSNLLEAKQRLAQVRLAHLGDAQSVIRALIQIAREQDALGQSVEAQATLQEAEDIAASIVHSEIEDYAFKELLALARAHVELGQLAESERLAAQAEAALPTLSSINYQKSVRAALAVTYHMMGNAEASTRHVTALREQIPQASAEADQSMSAWMNRVTWSTVVEPFVEVNAIDHVEVLLDGGTAEQAGYLEALMEVGEARLRNSDVAAARILFHRARAPHGLIGMVETLLEEGAGEQAHALTAQVLAELCNIAETGTSPWYALLELAAVAPNPGRPAPPAWRPYLRCFATESELQSASPTDD